MSFGTILGYLGVAILSGSPSALGMIVVFSLVLITYIKRVEEGELEARFGEQIRVYKIETPFLIPRWFSR